MPDFNKENQKIHSVEQQWHYPVLSKYNFYPVTKEVFGFVRRYEYIHNSGIVIICCTGYSSDYWYSKLDNKHGYWSELENYLKSILKL